MCEGFKNCHQMASNSSSGTQCGVLHANKGLPMLKDPGNE